MTHRTFGRTWQRWLPACSILIWLAPLLPATAPALAQSAVPQPSLCPAPALSRIVRHRVVAGETLASIAQRYNLIPATLMGLNPSLLSGTVTAGSEILVPPYNGIRVEVPAGQTWRDVAATYSVRADVLFEVNGCQPQPRVVFVPGVNWSPNVATPAQPDRVLTGYPLPATASILMGYGWQVFPTTGTVEFHSGVDLASERGAPVVAVGAGTIAFAGEQGDYGNLVVVNHADGLQTRYAQLDAIAVRVGQAVQVGDRLGTVGQTGVADRPHLHFEVRLNSALGWIAQDPSTYVENMSLARQ